jgi:hypothetical protein
MVMGTPGFGGLSAESGSESTGGRGPELSFSPRTFTDAAGTLVLASTAFLRSRTVEVRGRVTSKASARHFRAKVIEEGVEVEVGSAIEIGFFSSKRELLLWLLFSFSLLLSSLCAAVIREGDVEMPLGETEGRKRGRKVRDDDDEFQCFCSLVETLEV